MRSGPETGGRHPLRTPPTVARSGGSAGESLTAMAEPDPAQSGPADLDFPPGFLWGTATAGHQVEGDNVHSDWWAWENMPASPVKQASGRACEHYTRYRDDIALLAGLGLNAYRYSVEWPRIEPEDGRVDRRELEHYCEMTDAVLAAGMTPIVTLNHFTLPAWLGRRGGWLHPAAPDRFAAYCGEVVRALGERVQWYATLNEAGSVAFGGYLGALNFPPGLGSVRAWERATDALVAAHRAGREAVRQARPGARVGQTVAMLDWRAYGGGVPAMEYQRGMMEDTYLRASVGDDWIGVQTYTCQRVSAPAALAPLTRVVFASSTARRLLVRPAIRLAMRHFGEPRPVTGGTRNTLMGYEFRPEAIGATLRRAAELLPGVPLLVSEHGVATADDTEREEFITRGLAAVHECLRDGLPVLGYLHWSALDNFEWALGYRPTFGLIGVDRTTQARAVRPSAHLLGRIARTGRAPSPA